MSQGIYSRGWGAYCEEHEKAGGVADFRGIVEDGLGVVVGVVFPCFDDEKVVEAGLDFRVEPDPVPVVPEPPPYPSMPSRAKSAATTAETDTNGTGSDTSE